MQLVPLSTKKTKIAIVSLMIGGEDRFLELCSPPGDNVASEYARDREHLIGRYEHNYFRVGVLALSGEANASPGIFQTIPVPRAARSASRSS